MNTLDKMGCSSTHLMLKSKSVKTFDLYKIKGDDFENYFFGFTMMDGCAPHVAFDEDDNEITTHVLIDRKGLDSLIDFLNRLREERND